jgi:hypothetical protein
MTATTKASDLNLLLGKVFDEARSGLRAELEKKGRSADYESLKHDFIFHMTDWAEDLARFHAMREAPEVWPTEQATTFLVGFLYHVIPHLNAAGRLLVDEVRDTFADDDTARMLEQLK